MPGGVKLKGGLKVHFEKKEGSRVSKTRLPIQNLSFRKFIFNANLIKNEFQNCNKNMVTPPNRDPTTFPNTSHSP